MSYLDPSADHTGGGGCFKQLVSLAIAVAIFGGLYYLFWYQT